MRCVVPGFCARKDDVAGGSELPRTALDGSLFLSIYRLEAARAGLSFRVG